ncbi:MAG: MFS transporter [Alphaproteobacteria bacterium]|nr:MFS transporter [Alphaproteobacteria bacterium]
MTARLGAIRNGQFSMLSCAVGLACGAIGHAVALAACAVLVGWGLGPATPASSYLLARLAPADWRNIVFSIKQTGVPIGIGLAGLCVSLLTVGWSWRAGFWSGVGLCLVVAALLEQVRRRLDRDDEGLPQTGFAL